MVWAALQRSESGRQPSDSLAPRRQMPASMGRRFLGPARALTASAVLNRVGVPSSCRVRASVAFLDPEKIAVQSASPFLHPVGSRNSIHRSSNVDRYTLVVARSLIATRCWFVASCWPALHHLSLLSSPPRGDFLVRSSPFWSAFRGEPRGVSDATSGRSSPMLVV